MSDNEKKQPAGRTGTAPPAEAPQAEPDSLAELKRKAREVVYQTPEVRPEKVAKVQEAIQAGTYQIDSEKLADILLDELVPKP